MLVYGYLGQEVLLSVVFVGWFVRSLVRLLSSGQQLHWQAAGMQAINIAVLLQAPG